MCRKVLSGYIESSSPPPPPPLHLQLFPISSEVSFFYFIHTIIALFRFFFHLSHTHRQSVSQTHTVTHTHMFTHTDKHAHMITDTHTPPCRARARHKFTLRHTLAHSRCVPLRRCCSISSRLMFHQQDNTLLF